MALNAYEGESKQTYDKLNAGDMPQYDNPHRLKPRLCNDSVLPKPNNLKEGVCPSIKGALSY